MGEKKKNSLDHLSPEKKERAELAITKLEAVRNLKKLQKEDSDWSLLQELMQEIVAGHIVSDVNYKPIVIDLRKELISEIELRFEDDLELKKMLLDAVPTTRSVREWFKKDGWEDAVWTRLRADRLFSYDKRAEVIESLRRRALERSDYAAKIWLTLSGDYSDKMEVNDATTDTYREINKVLRNTNKKNSNE